MWLLYLWLLVITFVKNILHGDNVVIGGEKYFYFHYFCIDKIYYELDTA